MSGSVRITVNWDNLPEIKAAIKRIETDAGKRSALLKIYRRQAMPYIRAARRNIPVADRVIAYSRDKSIKYTPGNLRRSIKTFANKANRKSEVALHIGPQVKKAEGSGYYGYFLLPDAQAKIGHPRNGKRTNRGRSPKGEGKRIETGGKVDWVGRAFRDSQREMENGISRELAAHLKKVFDHNGFGT